MTEITLNNVRERLAAAVGGEAAFATSFSNRTFADLNKRAARLLDDAAQDALDLIERVNKAVDGEGLRQWHRVADEDLVQRYIRFWAAYQNAGARVANWMITGPANFPVARNQKRIATEDRRGQELDAFRKSTPARMVKRAQRIRKAELGASGIMDAELIDLQERHEKRIARQEMMKAANTFIRKHKLTEAGDGPSRLAALMRTANHPIGESAALALLKPNCFGGRGFESFSLSNNSAEIRRLSQRIEAVKAKLARAEAVESGEAVNKSQTIGGVEVIENAAEDRLQLIFSGKPSAEVRSLLKSSGFRWSPRHGAWQRQLTNSARYAAQRVTAKLAEAVNA